MKTIETTSQVDASESAALLCETCGYSIETLPGDGECPECGRPIATSLPGWRPGSPWQERPGLRSWVLTNAAALRRPRALMSRIRMEHDAAHALLWMNTLAAGTLISLPVAASMFLAAEPQQPGNRLVLIALGTTGMTVPAGIVVAMLLVALSGLEMLGVRVLGRMHRWRITSVVAHGVCAHASVGWIIGGALGAAGMAVLLLLGPAGIRRSHDWPLLLPVAGLLIGLITFETLVYIGIRCCKFTNT